MPVFQKLVCIEASQGVTAPLTSGQQCREVRAAGDMQHCAVVPLPCELFLVPGFLFVLCVLPNHTWLTPAGSQRDGMGMRWFVLGVPGNLFGAL